MKETATSTDFWKLRCASHFKEVMLFCTSLHCTMFENVVVIKKPTENFNFLFNYTYGWSKELKTS